MKRLQQLLSSQTHVRQLIEESNTIGIIICRKDGDILEANDAFLQITGYTRQDLGAGLNWRELTVPGDEARNQAHVEEMRGVGDINLCERECLRKDRSSISVMIGESVTDADEAIIFVFSLPERKRSQIELERLARIVESAEDAIISLTLDGTIVSWNKGAERLYGYSKQEMVGVSEKGLLLPGNTDEWHVIRDRVIRNEVIDSLNTLRLTKTGDAKPVKLTISPMRDENGNITGISSIARDQTQLVKAEQLEAQLKLVQKQEALELRANKEAAEAANRAKGEFLANMSHEIRTPMNGIIGMLDLALDTDLTPEQLQYLSVAKSSTESLLTVINDILDFSKVESGKLDFEMIDFDVRNTLGDILEPMVLQAGQKGLKLASHIDADLPTLLSGDPGRLRQVISNLVGNAIKFTEQGEIVVRAQLQESNAEDVAIDFSIKDTGCGIPAQRQKAIFAPFEQADGSITRKYGGTGLGLAIATRLITMMKGRIHVESEIGEGSTFHFSARFKVASSPPVKPSKEQPLTLAGLRVLIVDDNVPNRRFLEKMLRRWRMVPFCADDSTAALRVMGQALADQNPFNLVLIDCQMPYLDSFSVAEKIKQNQGLAGTTIMMLNSAGTRGDATRCRELGIVAYLTKPVTQSQLFDAIIAALGNGKEANGSSGLITRHSLRESHLLNVLLVEDHVVNQMIVTRMLEKLGHRVDVAKSGREALDAIAQRSFDAIFMDIQMPEMDGLEATKLIRQQEASTGRHLPIIAITAHAMDGDRERCLMAGMDAYVTKPVRSQDLVAAIRAVVVDANPTGCQPPVHFEDGDGGAATFERGDLLGRLEGDEKLLDEVVQLFRSEYPKTLRLVYEAADLGDAKMLQSAAHALRGAAANICAPQISATAGNLEVIARQNNFSGLNVHLDKLKSDVARFENLFQQESEDKERENTHC